MSTYANDMATEKKKKVIVFTCTYYNSVEESRFVCCEAMLENAVKEGIEVVVVDGSPSEDVREKMRRCGVHVAKQQQKGKKGVALREALALAMDRANEATLLCWQEPEKADMIFHWQFVEQQAGDCVVPMREDTLWKETYPIEQYYSENFANLYVSTAAKTFGGFETKLDWHFGPFGIRKRCAQPWLDHRGELWDAQVLPIVETIRRGLTVTSVPVPFRAPFVMKSEEEENFDFVQKRLMQINFLDPLVVDAFKASN